MLFVENTAHVELSVFTEACRRLETSAQWFPKVSELLEECRIVNARRQAERDEKRRKQITGAGITEAQWQDIQAKLKAIINKKSWR